MKRTIPLILVTLALTSGCMSMSGLKDSSSRFACKAPDGVACTSVSGVYANAEQNNLPALQSRGRRASGGATPVPGGATFPALVPGAPIRSDARMLRIWVAPWVDDEGTLHDQSYMYVMVDHGKWLVEKSREATVQKSLTHLRLIAKARASAASRQTAASSAVVEPSSGEAEK